MYELHYAPYAARAGEGPHVLARSRGGPEIALAEAARHSGAWFSSDEEVLRGILLAGRDYRGDFGVYRLVRVEEPA